MGCSPSVYLTIDKEISREDMKQFALIGLAVDGKGSLSTDHSAHKLPVL